ncbi:MAG: hypothetical protein A2Z34_09075 [Planctomycetes bacterium RBG_16_59_8]|nr:MAG: hypothetical protein A2Z34_09075 [Planctomycetes bacterium RBG_16_59_8]
MTYAETVFVVQTTDPHTLGESINSGWYGISRKAYEEHLPDELRDAPSNSAVFIRLKDSLQRSCLFGPLFLEGAPPKILSHSNHGIWHDLDAGRGADRRIPPFADRLPWCFFFQRPKDDRFGLITDDELQRDRISLPPWGILPPWLGKKLIAMSKGRLREATEHLEILGVKLAFGEAKREGGIVLSLPPHIRQEIPFEGRAISPTFETLREIMGNARESIRIFSPYIDATFTSLLQDVRVPVRIVTTPHRIRVYKPNPLLERLAGSQPLAVRYIAEESRGAHLYQLHAKMILCDNDVAYVGSANLTDTSIFYNIELGVLVTDAGMLATLGETFDTLFERFAFPSSEFKSRRKGDRAG